jgi:hypothetical protein
MTKALLVIDLQNDYFPGGKFPLWNTDAVLDSIVGAMEKANAQGIPVVIIQHVAKQGLAPFFNEGTPGAEIHARILAAAPAAPLVEKEFADSFERTNLEETLTKLGATELLVRGMMTQNCVTHTAISKAAENRCARPAKLMSFSYRNPSFAMTRWEARLIGSVHEPISLSPSRSNPNRRLASAISVAKPWFQWSDLTA